MTVRSLSTPQGPRPRQAGNGAGRLAVADVAEDSKPRSLEELCEQFVVVCESAVDPLEISSALEFAGLSDQTARKRYGASDVFALAEEMFRRVPRQAEPEALPDPWRSSKVRPALHGLLYGLPTICFLAATGLLAGSHVLIVLIVALLTSWALSQGLAYLGYLRLGRAEPAQAARLLLAGEAAGIAGVALALAVTSLAVHAHITALIFGLGLGAYMIGATVLMVLGAERLLLAAIAPGVLGSVTFLILGQPPQLEYAAWGALAATPLLALALAAVRASHVAGLFGKARQAPPAGKLVAAAELRDALPSAGFGLVAAALLIFPIAAALLGHRGPDTGAMLASLPLALSMGAAEWMLIWFRRRTQRLLRSTREPRVFAVRARLVLLGALLQYLIAAILLTAVVVAIAGLTGLVHLHATVLPQTVVYIALGGAMFVALLLQAFGCRVFPLIACAVALALEVVWRSLGVWAQLVACAELLVVLVGYAALVLGRALRHA